MSPSAEINAIEEGLEFRPKFDASGLVTCVATDAATGDVLMVAHMNDEALRKTIASGEATLPLMERVQTIYPRYLVAEPVAGPPGLTFRGFRDDSPYQGEELVFESAAPEHFLARCSRKGVNNSGTCLLERRIGNADITYRFPRDWLTDWKNVASGIDRLGLRLHPETK